MKENEGNGRGGVRFKTVLVLLKVKRSIAC